MKSYMIDEISSADMEKVQSFLRRHALRSSLDRIFWIQIPDPLLSKIQRKHRECRPHVFAVELGDDWIRLELFIRSLQNLHCSCPGYCNRDQLNFVVEFAQGMVERTGIRT